MPYILLYGTVSQDFLLLDLFLLGNPNDFDAISLGSCYTFPVDDSQLHAWCPREPWLPQKHTPGESQLSLGAYLYGGSRDFSHQENLWDEN